MSYIKLYENFKKDIKEIIFDILKGCKDKNIDISYYVLSNFYINSLEREITGIKVGLYGGLFKEMLYDERGHPTKSIPTGLTFKDIKSDVEKLISYMKSIGYSNFIYLDQETKFNQRRLNTDKTFTTQTTNTLPNDNDDIIEVLITFIED